MSGVVGSPPTTPAPAAATLAPVAVAMSPPTEAPAAAATPAPVTEVDTPSPTTSSRDLVFTPSPTAEDTAAESGASTEGASTTTTASDIPTDDVCLACYDDKECSACITVTDENEAEHAQCLEEFTLDNVCDSFFAVWCCSAALSGNDCMAIETYVDFITDCVRVESDEDQDLCPIEDMECAGVSDFGTAGTGAGTAVVSSSSTTALTCALGLAAVAAAGWW